MVQELSHESQTQVEVKITGVDIPFSDLFTLILKASLAAIPAYIVLFLLVAAFGGMVMLMAGR